MDANSNQPAELQNENSISQPSTSNNIEVNFTAAESINLLQIRIQRIKQQNRIVRAWAFRGISVMMLLSLLLLIGCIGLNVNRSKIEELKTGLIAPNDLNVVNRHIQKELPVDKKKMEKPIKFRLKGVKRVPPTQQMI